MPSHRLLLKQRAAGQEWILAWGEETFALKGPDGNFRFEVAPARALWLVDVFELYDADEINLLTPAGWLRFSPQQAAADDLRAFMAAGLGSNTEFRRLIVRQAKCAVLVGLAIFVFGGGVFSFCFWWAWWGLDPQAVGWLVHLVLLLLLGVSLAGVNVWYFGVRQLLRVRRIEPASPLTTRSS